MERDEGVFGIRPGTSITIAVKSGNSKDECKVYYAEQWGLRNKKFEWLDSHDIETTAWKEILPESASYLFITRDQAGWKTYKNFVGINDIFPINSVGIVTSRDDFVIDFDKRTLDNRIRTFIHSNDSDDIIKQGFGLKDNKSWKVVDARAELRKVSDWENYIKKILYRPFDERWIFYHPTIIERSREEVMQHMIERNLALCIGRAGTVTGSDNWDVVFVTDDPTDFNLYRRGGNVVYPLYVYYKQNRQGSIFDDGDRNQNINWDVLPGWMATIQPFTSATTNSFIQVSEAIFYYIYAVFYSNTYRDKYQEFLKSDFPRVPFTRDYQTFQTLAILGEQLVELHLLKAKQLDNTASRYEGKGDNRVEKRGYNEGSKSLFINDTQYFDRIAPEVWNYYIGGYQVLDKWLKDRVGRILSLEDQLHFRKMITALSETINIQERIDKLYPKIEETLNNENTIKELKDK